MKKELKMMIAKICTLAVIFTTVFPGSVPVMAEALPDEIAAMVQERAEARKNRDWAKSDELRDRIIKAGYILEDTKQGQKVRKDV